MHSPRRAREVARPRQVAMYLSKQLTNRSYPDIGRAFGFGKLDEIGRKDERCGLLALRIKSSAGENSNMAVSCSA